MLYHLHHTINQSVQPIHLWAQACSKQLKQPWMLPFRFNAFTNTALASLELIERCTDNYEKPEFGLHNTEINGEEVRVREEVAYSLPFCDLLHFRRAGSYNHPKVLLVAPLSGHYATLLRGTVENFLPDHEVYITDWQNARDVPTREGSFSFDDYVRYLIEFMEFLGPETNVIAVCQPSVPAVVAVTIMSERNNPNLPKTLTLMGGPIDTRLNPTGVNDYASGKDLEWFETKVICTVPGEFPGAGQRVYPGFIQLSGFMSMNMDNHINKHFKFFGDLIKGDGDSAEAHRTFYNEYLAVMDLPADFYLDTIRKVFLEHRLATGTMMFEDQQIDTKAVKNVALLTIEGENDDITGNGQTKAAHDVLSSIPDSLKMHYEQPNVGHYGIFNGRRFRQEVSPVIKDFIKKHADTAPAKVEEKAQPTPAKTASVTADTPSEKLESSKPAAPKTTTRAKRATSAKATTSKTETTARKTTAKRTTPAKATATKPAQPSAAKKAASSTAKAPETKTVTDTAADKATKA
ncbi:polyhydroxyalkanoate depolymerase [Neptunomonas phycophila]|uniref:Polyhydroxyalkanoate depolymerase n=1 Tax=Neptunomonas phycophila TaxID=1572645 RepID=A0ABT9EVX7_9GAMM|nr:polyhydroxyalkanoate depolymerase [Neptunomonas phycophila]MDP2523203.1 polyhydroxyalkanoate depolymerase [Neptunomonas phycophila]